MAAVIIRSKNELFFDAFSRQKELIQTLQHEDLALLSPIECHLVMVIVFS
jgi:hypothetical protein